MLQLYLAAFGAVVAANIIVVLVVAATLKRDFTRFWRLWTSHADHARTKPNAIKRFWLKPNVFRSITSALRRQRSQVRICLPSNRTDHNRHLGAARE
jgi:hypothetical protein